MTDAEFLECLDGLIAQAKDVGLCPLTFEVIKERVASLIKERDEALALLKDALKNNDAGVAQWQRK